MDELVVLVNKRDEIIASIELERERAASRDAAPQKPSTSTPEPVKGKFSNSLFFISISPPRSYEFVLLDQVEI